MNRFALRVFPTLTVGFIVINAVIYSLLCLPQLHEITSWTSMVAFGYLKGEESFTSAMTAMFMHADINHIIGNMIFLLIFGWAVEDDLGPFVFLSFYLFTGLMASVAHSLFGVPPSEEFSFSVGASGAVMGVVGGYLVLIPGARIQSFKQNGCVSVFISLIVGLMAAKAIYNDINAVLHPREGAAVAHWAHIGGFTSGAFLGVLLRPRLRTHREVATIRVMPKRKTNTLPDAAEEGETPPPEEETVWVNWNAVARVVAEGAFPPRVAALAQTQDRESLVTLLQQMQAHLLRQEKPAEAQRVGGLLRLLGVRLPGV